MNCTQEDQVLPVSPVDWVSEPLARFLKIEAASAILLLICALAAVMVANSSWATPFMSFWQLPLGIQIGTLDFGRTLQHWINDGLMAVFFFVVSLELKRELVLGELRDLRAASLPLFGAIGGMVVPALVYVIVLNGHEGGAGWGVVIATDTAFVIGSLALFGQAIPIRLRVLLVSLAVFDDLGSIAVVALVYAEALDIAATGSAILIIGAIVVAARAGVRALWAYAVLGALLWSAVDASGIHPTLAGVILGIMTPARAWVGDERLRSILDKVMAYPRGEHWSGDTQHRQDLKSAGRAVSEALSPLERLEMTLHPWIGFVILPVFALANAGVAFSWTDVDEPVVVATIAGLTIGKPVGVLLFIWAALRLRIATLAQDLKWPLLIGGAFLTGIGFTMSLFIAELAFSASLAVSAKAGIFIGSGLAASLGLVSLLAASRCKGLKEAIER